MSRRRPETPQPENHERWIIAYADMVTLLFALFVVLYATGDANPQKLQTVRVSIEQAFSIGVLQGTGGASPVLGQGGGLTPSLNEIRSNTFAGLNRTLSEFAAANGLDGRIQLRSDATSITISLIDNLLFDPGSADLRPGSAEVLLQIADALRGLPNELRIEGHTDSIPPNSRDYPTNWELSTHRATTVLRFLTEQGGLDPTKLYAAGYAETRPLADNATPEGRALNRRADIVILYPTIEELQRSLSGAQPR
jgi:chemotaxis protein MotB